MKYHTPLVKPRAPGRRTSVSPVRGRTDVRPDAPQRDRNSRRARAVACARIEKGSAPCDAKLQPGMATTEADIVAREAARPTAPPVVEFRRVSKRYDNGDWASTTPSFTVGRGEFVFLVGSTGSGKSTVMRLLIKELEPTVRDDPRRRARPGRDHAQEGAVLPAQPRRRLPGLQAAAQPHGARQRRLRAAGHRQLAQGDPREGARHPAPHRPVDQAAPLPRPALRRRAAARLGRARVRQPPAAAAGRRADRQPRSRDLDRDHAAALPHQPHGHDGHRRHPRLGHGRPHAPARDRARARAHHPRRGRRASTRRATCRPPSSARCCASRRPSPQRVPRAAATTFDEAFRD